MFRRLLSPMARTTWKTPLKLSPFFRTQKRTITFTRGTEGLQHVKDPTLQKNIREIDAQDKVDKRETVVLRAGTFSHYRPGQRHVYLPLGDSDPVVASHELQHARDYVKLDALPGQKVLERRAFNAQLQTARHLDLPDQLRGKTIDELAEQHSQVRS